LEKDVPAPSGSHVMPKPDKPVVQQPISASLW
jgi:hypothetical protein